MTNWSLIFYRLFSLALFEVVSRQCNVIETFQLYASQPHPLRLHAVVFSFCFLSDCFFFCDVEKITKRFFIQTTGRVNDNVHQI